MLKPTVQVHHEDGVLIAEFWDCLRLDPAPVQELRRQVEAHLRAGGRPDVVIDLSGVGFAGSTALGHFLTIQRLIRSQGGRIVFFNVDSTVQEVFRLTKIESLFSFVADKSAALALLRRPSAEAEP
ncbi:MAG: STAS domain-containing protein, partial [Isosphaeraceae bacterium]|nr:STAS domain-containing protein [Isosphaeraceae bacterium]